MATARRVRELSAGGVLLSLAAVVLLVPVPALSPAASQAPQGEAGRAERELPTLGVAWGKLRGWERVGAGWALLWQPAHGAWLVRAFVPDAPGRVRWRIEAAPWLPGVRLSREAARVLAADAGATEMARERLGRRDWLVGESQLFGALPAGGALPALGSGKRHTFEALLAGLLLAGAVSRRLIPGLVARAWRRTVGGTGLILALAVPFLTPLANRAFRAGVRPWVAELAFGTAAVLLLGALAFAAQHFPTVARRPPGAWLAAAAATGVLAGRLEPVPWLAAVAGLPLRLVVWVAVAVLAGWLAGLAGDGLCELLRFSSLARVLSLGALGVAAVLHSGPWLGVALAVLAAGAVGRDRGTPMAVSLMAGWVLGVVSMLCQWEAAQHDALVLLLLGATALGILVMKRRDEIGVRT